MHTQLHQIRSAKLRKLTRFRIEIEGILEKLSKEYLRPCFTTLTVEKAKAPIEGNFVK